MPAADRHRSAAASLAGLYAALVVYASLYPFSGWRWAVRPTLDFLSLPWPAYWTPFDLIANLLGYVPLGVLLFGALLRSGWRVGWAALLAFLGGTALSFSLEWGQNFLPMRVPSNIDLALNAAGTALGVALGQGVHLLGGVVRWQRLRDRWFVPRSGGGLTLLLLWPLGLLFPTPAPLALGPVIERARDGLAEWLLGTAGEAWLAQWWPESFVLEPLSPAAEFAATSLGLMAPCLLAFSVARPGWRRPFMALGAAALGFVATTLSTVLNFGPDHALAWRTPVAWGALGAGLMLAALLSWLPRRLTVGLCLMVITAMLAIVAQFPTDPYFSQSLQAWEQGRFIRFHGAAQWVGWLWPFATLAYLLGRFGADDAA
jgi:VanZ family protein